MGSLNNMSELDLLLKKIDKYDVISFDIFDTLLLRNVLQPSDIFLLLENEVKEKFSISNFAQIRIDAEARSRTAENGFETSLQRIYDEIKDINSDVKKQIMDMELSLEDSFLVANPFMKKVYDYAKKKNKTIICITDMYLPQEFLRATLEKNGYKNVKIYLSCDYMKQKRDGSLFIEVFKETGFNKDSWLHIGDNQESDYNQPRALGIEAYHYVKVLDRAKIDLAKTNLELRIIYAILYNQTLSGLYERQEIDDLNKTTLAKVFFLFWVYNNISESKQVYFSNELEPYMYFLDKLIEINKDKISLDSLSNSNLEKSAIICLLNWSNKYSNLLADCQKILLYEGQNKGKISCFNIYSRHVFNGEHDLLNIYMNYLIFLKNTKNIFITKSNDSLIKRIIKKFKLKNN